ncbi:MAG: serine hydrolase [Pseudomonadota bacterium]
MPLLLSLFALCFAQPAGAASSPSLTALEQQLNYMVAGKSADVGIAALDLTTGESINVKGEIPFPMASTVKIAVAAAYLTQVDHGRRTMLDTIGKDRARDLMSRMLVHSDNRATDLLIKDLGGPAAIQDWLNFHGFSGIRVDRNIAKLLSDPRDLWDRRDSSTPLAMVELLRRLDRGNVLSASSRRTLLEFMSQCETGKNRMKALLPEGTRVEHKTGTLNGLSDDVGFVTMPDGRRVAIAIFTRGGSDRPRTIAETARALYDGFRSVVTWSFSPTPATR